MIHSEVIFKNIQKEILLEISKANENIYIAVAWFTDSVLFNAILEKLTEKVQVNLIVANDAINFSNYGLDFEKFKKAGGNYFTRDSKLMHNKFCVIDGKTVINGSYNWTKSANNNNDENILIINGDVELAKNFIAEFNKLCGVKTQTTDVEIPKIIKRLKLIESFIDLNESEDITVQLTRLNNEDPSSITGNIVALLKNDKYIEAKEKINKFIAKYNQLTKYIDPEIEKLKFEIKLLEYHVLAVDYLIAEAEIEIGKFNHLLHERLGSLMEELYDLKEQYYLLYKDESKEAEKKYKETKENKQKFKEENIAESKKVFHKLTDAVQAELKKLYRQASMLCHPDKLTDAPKEIQQKAEEIFKQLSEANSQQDFERVKAIFQKLQNGILNVNIKQEKTRELLIQQRQELKIKLKEVVEKIQTIMQSSAYKILEKEKDLDKYFNDFAKTIKEQIVEWKEKIAKHA